MHIDPFEEIEMAEKSAEQHRRSAAEKEVNIHAFSTNISFCSSYSLYQV